MRSREGRRAEVAARDEEHPDTYRLEIVRRLVGRLRSRENTYSGRDRGSGSSTSVDFISVISVTIVRATDKDCVSLVCSRAEERIGSDGKKSHGE